MLRGGEEGKDIQEEKKKETMKYLIASIQHTKRWINNPYPVSSTSFIFPQSAFFFTFHVIYRAIISSQAPYLKH